METSVLRCHILQQSVPQQWLGKCAENLSRSGLTLQPVQKLPVCALEAGCEHSTQLHRAAQAAHIRVCT